ncbi:serine hydrolase domain-containing protein [Cytophaga aurantiaca]|uniref:serine hydrolase domain-containing protein n=1 Tax=Cytophaga aurantiaca TaxID=29530 RepID=UPI000379C5F3|nr:serine hydrolase [Cytophaga aurantiaca]
MSSAFTLNKITLYVFIIFFSFSSCLPYDAYIHIVPDQKDIKRFKHVTVKHADTCFEFHKAPNKPIFVSNWTHKSPLSYLPLEDFLKNQKCNHFMVIKNDSIVFEYNNKKLTSYEPSPIFSITKCMVSASLGVAIKQGYIKSINDLVKDYLPELNYDKNFDLLTLNHLLNQESGVKESVNNLARTNYGKIEMVLRNIKFTSKPGEKIEYVNTNYTLLGLLIERVTKKDMHEYFSENIWTKIGTCDSTVWGYDFQSHHTRSFSFFGGSTRDLAKFGRLYMNKGMWNGKEIIDSNWVKQSTSNVNGLGKNIGYNSSFYIGEKEVGDFTAIGMYRQQIYVNPKSNVVIVGIFKFNNDNLPLRWWQLMRKIAEQA